MWIVASLGEVTASIEVLRPGRVVIDEGAAAHYHGSEDRAVEMIIDTALCQGIDLYAGVADEITTAVIAARSNGGGASKSFLLQQALLSSSPYTLSWGATKYLITGWARPWPVDDRWWEKTGTKYARFQVVEAGSI
ncbi:hypothetical protein [Corynebacterium crudilactis]|nr:hypothetical protein [Corynebacterium crudilactis]